MAEEEKNELVTLDKLQELLAERNTAFLEAMFRFRYLHRVTYLPQLFIQSLVGFLLLGTGSYSVMEQEAAPAFMAYLPLFGGCVDLLLAGYRPVLEYWQFEEKAKLMEQAHLDHEEILTNLRFQGYLPPSQRTGMDDIYREVHICLEKHSKTEGLLPPHLARDLNELHQAELKERRKNA